ncbi:hypothetical protein [Bartonella sp. TP]|uniref:hypothetical protein n=1 Tax=Bartonella sp. TP TaxID=3057550 RepID=UPI0025B1A91F|nr:hypothetical protein [Bartonella sp. TP]WJW80016.1 hypothetical protein QVL57_00155 [Bartonella sp. TP]
MVVAIAIVSALGVIKTLIVLAFLGLVFLLMLTHSLYELTREVYRSVSRLEKELSESKTEINFAIRNLERRNYSALNHSSQTDKTNYLFHD